MGKRSALLAPRTTPFRVAQVRGRVGRVRRAARKDGPHRAAMEALRAAGASVAVLETRPEAPGVPDLLVGHRGRTMLVEVKAARADLSPAQEAWRRGWRGCPVAVVHSPAEALDALDRLA